MIRTTMRSLLESAMSMELVTTLKYGGTKSISQHGKVKHGKQVNQVCHILLKTHSPDGSLRNQMA